MSFERPEMKSWSKRTQSLKKTRNQSLTNSHFRENWFKILAIKNKNSWKSLPQWTLRAEMKISSKKDRDWRKLEPEFDK